MTRFSLRIQLLLVAMVLCPLPSFSAAGPGVRGSNGMVVTPDRYASEAGLAALKAGGNAIDAAVTATLVLSVTFPEAAPIGGGGFLLYRSPDVEYHALDFRETAPAALDATLFRDKEGQPDPSKSLNGGLSVGVPGTVAGLYDAHARWGRLEWRQVVEPALRLAQEGFVVSEYLAGSMAESGEKFLANPASTALFLRGEKTLPAGTRLHQSDLAQVLRRIAQKGSAGFYAGPTADAFVAAVRQSGGVMTAEDLEAYRPQLRQPVVGSYRGHRIVSFPPPSSGGIVLLQILGMMERYDLKSRSAYGSQTVHWMAEIERRAFADRSKWLGDPDFYSVPVNELVDPSYLKIRASTILDDRTSASETLQPGDPKPVAHGETLHLSVSDASGGAVALTVTLNASYGNGMVATGTGILMNNEIDDFAVFPGIPNLYGLVGGTANAIEGGKRPLSSMTPTIVEYERPSGRPMIVLGSPGGSRIITSVAQIISRVIDHGMSLQEAVNSPRFHHQWLPDRIDHEPDAFAEDTSRALAARGHALHSIPTIGSVNAIGVDAQGRWIGAADPRRESTASGY